ncbi:MAG: hypothetical protein AABO58_14620 [Acidobacteriota bacterium]
MTHYLYNNQVQRVILYQVANHPHQPRLTVNPDDLQPGSSPRDDGDGIKVSCFNLDGKVAISGINAVKPLSLLGEHIAPSLDAVSAGGTKNVRTEVQNGTPVPGEIPVIVTLNEGVLFVWDYFKELAIFPNSTVYKVPRAMPRTVIYGAPASGDVTITDDGGKIIILKYQADVWLTNLPRTELGPPMPHYDAQSQFFDPNNPVTVDNPVSDGPCSFGSDDERPDCGGGSAAGVECSNSQYP